MAHLDHLPQALNRDPEFATRPANIIISGTTMWNPGDDFVRAGVIAVLRKIVSPRPLNLFFYNFSADVQPPHGHLGGIGNDVSAGDLEALRGVVDAVVIAGLSAGTEIKPLYRWVIDAGLTDRVLMIGAGYENDYVDRHCREDPESTVFRDACFITGRTAKTPDFIASLGTPYAHIPCPSLLSVDSCKPVPCGRRARRLGFSIQLPHRLGIVNHATGVEASALAESTMLRLADEGHDITLIAHHKTEYLDQAVRYRGTPIKVVFQTFATDLPDVYRGLDAMITTRLHAGLYANAHGIPSLIINDTDRHTHALDGFRHASWASTPTDVEKKLDALLGADLGVVRDELADDKSRLMERYESALAGPVRALIAPEDPRERLGTAMRRAMGSRAVKHRVLANIAGLEPDHWLGINIGAFRESAKRGENWFDAVTAINWLARALRPRTYVEVGVRRGRSLAQVLIESPDTAAFGFDMWIPDYGSIPERGIHVRNPGPSFVADQLAQVGAAPAHALIEGDSKRTLPSFFDDPRNPREIDLLHIDGDHTEDGARRDLEVAFARVAPGGAIVFDDLRHPSHPELLGVWQSFKADRPDWLFVEDQRRNGTAVAVRPPFDRLGRALERSHTRSQAGEEGETPIPDGGTIVIGGVPEPRKITRLAREAGPEGRVFVMGEVGPSLALLRGVCRNESLDSVIVHPVADGTDAGEIHGVTAVDRIVIAPAATAAERCAAERFSRAEQGRSVEIKPGLHAGDRAGPALPIHFFTIVLNGMPFIRHHLDALIASGTDWYWHIVEGVGNLVHDTAWSVRDGGVIPTDLHRDGRSTDGTSAYLDEIAAAHPDRIRVYRKPPGVFWDGKVEMVNAPLANITEACLLWQVDADELWTGEQIRAGRELFERHPEATAAYYRCHYFVGPDRVITSRDTYGNHSEYEWLRTWRYTPGCRWAAHEPPRLLGPGGRGEVLDLGRMSPLMHESTEAAGLVFQHFAYANEAQLRFKESYYGYAGAVEQWRSLQRTDSFPARLADHFSWVKDDAIVELAREAGVVPLLDAQALRCEAEVAAAS